MRQVHGKTWACHNDTSKPCAGAIRFQREKGLDARPLDPELVTEASPWHTLVQPFFNGERVTDKWITNISRASVISGYHYYPGQNAMLISIIDPDANPPTVYHSFKEKHTFAFWDINEADAENAISDADAKEIAELLIKARDQQMNVVVHCTAGLCRSGAVTEAAVAFGLLNDTGVRRQPNTLVKGKLFNELQQRLGAPAHLGKVHEDAPVCDWFD